MGGERRAILPSFRANLSLSNMGTFSGWRRGGSGRISHGNLSFTGSYIAWFIWHWLRLAVHGRVSPIHASLSPLSGRQRKHTSALAVVGLRQPGRCLGGRSLKISVPSVRFLLGHALNRTDYGLDSLRQWNIRSWVSTFRHLNRTERSWNHLGLSFWTANFIRTFSRHFYLILTNSTTTATERTNALCARSR